MNRTALLGILSVIAYGALLAGKYVGSGPKPAEPKAVVAVPAAPHAGSVHTALGNLEVHHASALPTVRTGVAVRTQLSVVAQNFRAARDLKSFADALLARKDSLNREERYYLAKALETCLFATSINDDLVAASEKQRRQFLSGIPAADPNAARRIAAYDAADDTQRCLRFQGTPIAQRDIDELYRQAAAGGDPRAMARQLVAELNKNLGTPKDGGENRPVAGDDFQRIIGLLETKDADAMIMVAQFLAQNRLIGELRIGPNGETPEPASLVGAFALVACDFQPTCSTFDRESQQACAYAGYCSAGSYDELFANFIASPWAYAMAMRYREVIHSAIDTRNWSLLGLQKLIGVKARPIS